MSRQEFNSVDVLKLLVQRPPNQGELVNLIVNPSGYVGQFNPDGTWRTQGEQLSVGTLDNPTSAWGWLSEGESTVDSGAMTLVARAPRWLAFVHYAASEYLPSHSEPFRVTPGYRMTGRFEYGGATFGATWAPTTLISARLSFQWRDVNETVIGESAAVSVLNSGTYYLPTVTVPAAAASAQLKVLVVRSSGMQPTAYRAYFKSFMVTESADPTAFGTTRTNLLPNPSYEVDTLGWATTGGAARRVRAPGFPAEFAYAFNPVTGGGSPETSAAAIDVTPGQPYTFSAYLRGQRVIRPGTLRMQWRNAANAVLSTSTQAVANMTPLDDWLRVSMTATAPANAARLVVSVVVDQPGNNNATYLNRVMIEQADELRPFIVGSIGADAFAYVEPFYWTDVLGPTHDIVVDRERLGVGTLTATILDAALDPSQGELIRPGRKVALVAGSNYDILFMGEVRSGRTTYAPHRTDERTARVVLNAVDAGSRLASIRREQSFASYLSSALILEGCGVPYAGNHHFPMSVAAYNDNASALDQIQLSANSALDWKGTITRQGYFGQYSTIFNNVGPREYTNLDVSYATDDCINEVRIRATLRPDAEGRSETQTFGPYRDHASIAEWGARAREIPTVGLVTEAAAQALARDVLARNANPKLRVSSMRFPMRTMAQLNRVAALHLIDTNSRVGITNGPAKMNNVIHDVYSVKHEISPDRWMITVGMRDQGAAAPSTTTPDPTPTPTTQIVSKLLTTAPHTLNVTASAFSGTTIYARRSGQTVILEGNIRRTSGFSSSWTVIGRLPAEYAPGSQIWSPTYTWFSDSFTGTWQFSVMTNGDLRVRMSRANSIDMHVGGFGWNI